MTHASTQCRKKGGKLDVQLRHDQPQEPTEEGDGGELKPTFRGMLETAVDDGLHDLRLEEEVPEAGGVDADVGALLLLLLVLSLGGGGGDLVLVINQVVSH